MKQLVKGIIPVIARNVFVGSFILVMVVVYSPEKTDSIDCGKNAGDEPNARFIECGQEIGPGGVFVLERDLDCERQCFGLVVIGPTVLDMNGKTIFNAETGILIEGKGARILDGSVAGGLNGVVVTGEGRHQIISVIAKDNQEDGFKILAGDSNYFEKDEAINNSYNGFYVQSDKNYFVNILSAHNKENGILAVTASNNLFLNSLIRNNKARGLSLSMSDYNRFVNSKVINNLEQEGIRIDKRSDGNMFFNNTVTNNGLERGAEDGFDIRGQRNLVINCVSSGHLGDGFKISGKDNILDRNQAIKNGENGFHIIKDSLNNTLVNNTGQQNGNSDLRDDNAECEMNVWIKNEFATSAINKNCLK